MQKPMVAIQMIVFSSEVLKHGYEKILRFIKELGANEIELSKVPVNRDTVPEIERLCKEFGMHVCAMKMKGRADLVHLKDYRIVMPPEGVTGEQTSPKELRKKDVQFAEIGEGSLDMPGIINACIETGVKYMPIEQDTSYDLSPYDSIRISVENIREMGFTDCF